jgi:hypothetical protein
METMEKFHTQASIPESYEYCLRRGRSSDLLPFCRLPVRWLADSGLWNGIGYGAYSCGTVTELRRIPF